MKRQLLLLAFFTILNSLSLQASDPQILGQQLIEAARSGQLEKVQELITQGANVNAKDKWSSTPLHNATYWGRKEVISLLLSYAKKPIKKNYALTESYV